MDTFQRILLDPAWWTAAFTALLGVMAIFAFVAARRGANAAVMAYGVQNRQLEEMRAQTNKMREEFTADPEIYGLSLWVSHTEEGDPRVMYVNTTGHPYYNVYLEITWMSDSYITVPVLEPAPMPTEVSGIEGKFNEELARVGLVSRAFARPGIAYQFDTPSGKRYMRDNSGAFFSAGGGPHRDAPHHVWRPF